MNDFKTEMTAGGGCTAEVPIAARALSLEPASEFLIPDYMPELRRMISASARVLPAAQYLTPGCAEFAGALCYRILYEGADDAVWSADLPGEYEARLTAEDAAAFDGEAFAYADVSCEAVTVRVLAPRKLSIRARLRADAVIVGRRRCDVALSGAASLPAEDIKQLAAIAENAAILRGRTEATEYSDSFLPEDGEAGELRVLGCHAEVFVSESSASVEGVAVRGEIIASIMICRDAEGARPFTVSRRIPFRDTVPLERVPEQTAGCRAWGCVESTSVDPDENGGISCSFGLVLTAEAIEPRAVEYTADAYSMSCDACVRRRELELPHPLRCFNANISISGGEELSALGLDGGMRVVDAHVEAISIQGGENDGRFALGGRLRVRVCLDDGAQLTAKDIELPFRYEPESLGGETVHCAGGYSEWVAGTPICRARIDGDRLCADCEVTLAVRLCARERISAVQEVQIGEARAERGGGITVFYPTAEDSLWSIAKRYGADADELATANGIVTANVATTPVDARFLVI